MTISELKEYIHKNNKIKFILHEIGCHHIVYHQQKDYYRCGNVDGDGTDSVVVKNNEYLNCKNYTRQKHFAERSDLLTLVQYNKKLENDKFTILDTVKYLHKILDLPFVFKTEKKQNKKADPLQIFKKIKRRSNRSSNVADIKTLDESELHDFIPYIHIDWFREGIIGHTIEKFGLAYSFKYKRNVIPLRYWLTGELLGFNMRTTVENYDLLGITKYYITPNYQKSLNIFGLWENMDAIQEAGYVVIHESEKSVLKRHSLNDGTCVALSGHDISDEQIKILIGLDVEIIIALDNDISLDEVRHMCEKFFRIRKVSYMRDRWDLLDKKDSPADAVNKIYNFMLQYRTVYDESEHRKYETSMKHGK